MYRRGSYSLCRIPNFDRHFILSSSSIVRSLTSFLIPSIHCVVGISFLLLLSGMCAAMLFLAIASPPFSFHDRTIITVCILLFLCCCKFFSCPLILSDEGTGNTKKKSYTNKCDLLILWLKHHFSYDIQGTHKCHYWFFLESLKTLKTFTREMYHTTFSLHPF